MKNPPGTLKSSEIAQLLGITRRAVLKRAKKENWHKSDLPGQGGMVHYYIVAQIPEPTRSKILGLKPPFLPRRKSDIKLEKAISHLVRATQILTELASEGYAKKEINRILSLAKQSLRMPREEKSS